MYALACVWEDSSTPLRQPSRLTMGYAAETLAARRARNMPTIHRGWLLSLLMLLTICAPGLLAAGGHGLDGTQLGVWMAIPFAGILLSIAICPLVAPHWWHHHFGKVSAFWAVLGALFLLMGSGWDFGNVLYEVMHIVFLDYVPFIILLLGLFTIAGGIRIKGQLRGSPKLNTLLLLIGTVLASFMGTTGAAMLMIRPMIKANAWRKRKVHLIVFFIFLVCNIGGALTPLGDPPLFLGFLRGVDFTWTFNLLPTMLLISIPLLTIFFIMDTILLKKEEHQTPPVEPGAGEGEKFGIEGGINFLLLGGLIAVILVSSIMAKPGGAFYDQQKADDFTTALTAADTMTNGTLDSTGKKVEVVGLKQAALAFGTVAEDGTDKTRDAAGAIAAYEKALANLSAAMTPVHHADDAAEAHGDDHAHDDHKHPTSTLNNVTAEDVTKRGGKPEWAGPLSNRLTALQNASSLSDDEKTALQRMLVLDFQLASIHTNGIRAAKIHDSTKAMPIGNGVYLPYANLLRDLVILLLAFISWKVTRRESRTMNGFTWFPILEVAKLFAGIFICIIPALKILSSGVTGSLGGVVDAVTDPSGQPINEMYFWLTGILSSFLDNAPTYLVFFNTAGGDAQSLMGPGFMTLLAISEGAVFMGANTYIGNAPNFMVKAIAEESDIKMPSFFGYMVWSLIFLIPLFALLTWLTPYIEAVFH